MTNDQRLTTNGEYFPTRNRHSLQAPGEGRGGGSADPGVGRVSGNSSRARSSDYRTCGRCDYLQGEWRDAHAVGGVGVYGSAAGQGDDPGGNGGTAAGNWP